jgi:hypothetical protein
MAFVVGYVAFAEWLLWSDLAHCPDPKGNLGMKDDICTDLSWMYGLRLGSAPELDGLNAFERGC